MKTPGLDTDFENGFRGESPKSEMEMNHVLDNAKVFKRQFSGRGQVSRAHVCRGGSSPMSTAPVAFPSFSFQDRNIESIIMSDVMSVNTDVAF